MYGWSLNRMCVDREKKEGREQDERAAEQGFYIYVDQRPSMGKFVQDPGVGWREESFNR